MSLSNGMEISTLLMSSCLLLVFYMSSLIFCHFYLQLYCIFAVVHTGTYRYMQKVTNVQSLSNVKHFYYSSKVIFQQDNYTQKQVLGTCYNTY